MKSCLLFLSACASSMGAYALPAPELVETLVVSAPPTPAEQLTANSMRNSIREFLPGARLDPAEMLASLPGVQVDSRTNYAQDARISLRGFGARSAFGTRGIELLVDGIPMSTPDGQGQISSVILDAVESAQVTRGPMAGLYGNGAGGVIALQTATPDKRQLRLASMAGDQGLERYHWLGEWRRGDLALRGQFADTQVSGDRPHSSARREQAAVQMFYQLPRDLELVVKHEHSDEPLLEDPLGLTLAQWQADPWQPNPLTTTWNTRKSVEHRQSSLSLREQAGDTRWQASLWQGERTITQYLALSGDAITGSGGVVDLARDFAGANTAFTQDAEWLGMPLEFSLGAEMARMQDRRRGYVNNRGVAGDLRRDELGEVVNRDLHSLVQLHPSDRWTLYTGARRTWVDVDVQDYFVVPGNPDDSGAREFRESAYAVGGSYSFSPGWELFASRGRGYETPTLTEMAYRVGGTGLNTGLDAARIHQRQWGINYRQGQGVYLSLTHFRVDTSQELVVDQSVGGRTSFRNAAGTEREGVEFLARWQPSDAWRWQASAQHLRADYSFGEWSGKQLPGVAREQYQLGVEWRPLRSDGLQLHLFAQQRARIFVADNNQQAAPGFLTLDASARGDYEVDAWALGWWIKLANLCDETYVGSVVVNQANGRAFEPALGRNLSGGLSLARRF